MPAATTIPAEFLAQFDAERAAVLRRRAIWYSITILAMVAFSWFSTLHEIWTGQAFTGGDSVATGDVLTDTLFSFIFGGTLIYFTRRVRPRADLVRTFQWVIAVSGVTAVAVTPLVMNASWIPGATLDHTPETDLAQAFASILTVFILHFLASVFVALSPREGLAPLVPIFAAFAVWVAFVSVGSLAQRVTLIAAAPLAAAPGLAWSWWRYRSFTDRFHARAVQKRYSEVTRELTDARRIHEALFPPPITRGPVRVAYHYEPMREIGGDFLFVRPLAFPPSTTDGPVLVVLIDVTGHGIAAALAVNRLHAELERLCIGDAVPSPREVIVALNAFVCRALSASGMFATAIALAVEPGPNPIVRWAGAGHPPAFLRGADGTVRALESTAPMLGVIDADLFECTEGRTELAVGSTALAYTDGANEATDASGRQLGLAGLRTIIGTGTAGGRSLADAVAAAVETHRAGPPTDDTLIVELMMHSEPERQ